MSKTRKSFIKAATKPFPFASGTSKNLSFTQPGRKSPMFDFVAAPGKSVDDYVIATFKKDANINIKNLKGELELYHIFADANLSPKILYVNVDGKQMSIRTFISNVNSFTTLSYLCEKNQCDDRMLAKVKDYSVFFQNIKQLLKKCVDLGYFNMDTKMANLCIDSEGNHKIIDLDPKFVNKIIDQNNREHYLNYMMYQLYLTIAYYYDNRVKLHDTGLTANDIVDMVSYFLKNDEIMDEHRHEFNPISMMLYYLQCDLANRTNYEIRIMGANKIVSYIGDIVQKSTATRPKTPVLTTGAIIQFSPFRPKRKSAQSTKRKSAQSTKQKSAPKKAFDLLPLN